jgi:hypothetical protein
MEDLRPFITVFVHEQNTGYMRFIWMIAMLERGGIDVRNGFNSKQLIE